MLDRRFLSVSLTVLAIADSPADNPSEGTQYIVGANPSEAFAGEVTNSIARYDGVNWKFILPDINGLEVLNAETGDILRYNGTAWTPVASVFASIPPVLAVLPAGNTLPLLAHAGDAFLNTTTAKLHTATSVNEWDAGISVPNGSRYASTADFKIYQSDGNSLTATPILDGALFFNKEESSLYLYDASVPALVKLNGTNAVSSSAVTEIHTLTAEEVSAKSFFLPNAVASGQENNVLLFVSGVAQAAGVDFIASAHSISWNNKGLESHKLTAGDVFIVHYVTA